MLFIFINALILFAHYLFLSRFKFEHLSGKLTAILLLWALQIVLSEIILGSLNQLYFPKLFLLNLVISSFIILRFRPPNKYLTTTFKNDWDDIREAWQEIKSPSNLFLILLLVFVSWWFILASLLLPPRGVDDLGYHLPPIYHYITHHNLEVLPPEPVPFVAYPQNADMLFMWPTIFVHNTSLIGLVQFTFSIIGIVAIYALAQMLGLSAAISFFVAIQFFFTPVVLAQAGSAYVDNISAVVFLMALYFSAMFFKTKREVHLYLAALSIGFLTGTKYTMVIPAAFLQIFILPVLWKEKKTKSFFLYLFLLFLAGGYWYIRNYIVFDNPIFPVNLTQNNFGVMGGIEVEKFNFLEKLIDIPFAFAGLFLFDLGLGSFHGGFGIAFWGIAFPAWLYFLYKSFNAPSRERFFLLCFWGTMLLGFGLLFLVPLQLLYLDVRYSLFMVGIGVLAIGKLLTTLKPSSFYQSLIKSICIMSAILSVVLLAKTSLPSYAIDYPIYDFVNNRMTSKNRYLHLSSYMPPMDIAWELLDYLTQDEPKGLNVYMAAKSEFFWTAPTYGSNLQNRVWNHEKSEEPPDAFLYYFRRNGAIDYVKQKIELKDVLVDPRYELVFAYQHVYFLILKDFIDQPDKKLKLAHFYSLNASMKKDFQGKVIEVLKENIPVLTSSVAGYAIKYLNLVGAISNSVYFVPPGEEEYFAKHKGFKEVYTSNVSLKGFKSKKIYQTDDITIYHNVKK